MFLSISEPGTGFHIAFKMLDDDGNEQVDRKEFLKVKRFEWVTTTLPYIPNNKNNTLAPREL